MKRIGWAVAGMGLQGQRLVRAIEQSKSGRLVATASERERGSFEAVLKNEEVDAVAIATPNHQHKAMVIAAANAGKHILCEKPLALSSAEGAAIARAVRKNRIHCFVNYHLRMHTEAQRAKQVLKSKQLGDITYIEMHWSIGGLAGKKLPPLPKHMAWREDPQRSGGGSIMARGVHLFDLLRYITDEEVRVSRAWSDANAKSVDRTAVGLFLAGKTPALIVTSKAIVDSDNHIAVHGIKGKLVLRDIFKDNPQSLYIKVFDAFAGALSGKNTPLATLDEGIAAVKIVEAFVRTSHRE